MMDYNDGLLPEPCLRMDTHFGDDYESVEFGDGTGYVKAAPMLAMIGALHVGLDELRDENAKLREPARLLLWGVDNDVPRYEELAWTQKVNVLVRELGVEVE